MIAINYYGGNINVYNMSFKRNKKVDFWWNRPYVDTGIP